MIRNEIINSNNENSEKLLLDDESPPKNANIIKNKEENYITEINKEKENNNKNEKEKIFDDKFEELAKKMTNEIMNLNCFRVKENNENYQKNNNIKLKLSQNNKNIISDKYNQNFFWREIIIS